MTAEREEPAEPTEPKEMTVLLQLANFVKSHEIFSYNQL